MPKAIIYNMAGEKTGEYELSEAVFGVEPNTVGDSFLLFFFDNFLEACFSAFFSVLLSALALRLDRFSGCFGSR